MTRKACEKHGHRWIESIDGWRPAVQCCRRWFCSAMRADPMLPPELRADLDAMADLQQQIRGRY